MRLAVWAIDLARVAYSSMVYSSELSLSEVSANAVNRSPARSIAMGAHHHSASLLLSEAY